MHEFEIEILGIKKTCVADIYLDGEDGYKADYLSCDGADISELIDTELERAIIDQYLELMGE